MNNLYDAPFSFLGGKGGYGDSCLYKIDNKEIKCWKIGACHNGVKDKEEFNPKNKHEFFIYIRKDRLSYSFEDLKRWMRFMRYCGFKFHFLKEENISLGATGEVYGSKFTGEVYTYKLKCEEYINNMHIFAALTAMRYIYYDFYAHYVKIPEIVFNLKKEFKGKIDGIQALLLAYRCAGVTDYSHSFSGTIYQRNRAGCVAGLTISKKEFYERINKIKKDASLNETLYGKTDKKISEIPKLYKEGNFKELRKFIKS